MHKTNFYWDFIAYTVFFIFYHEKYHIEKQSFIKNYTCYIGAINHEVTFHWVRNSFSIGAINHAFSIEAILKH